MTSTTVSKSTAIQASSQIRRTLISILPYAALTEATPSLFVTAEVVPQNTGMWTKLGF